MIPLRRTRIVCTIGPSSSSPHVLRAMVLAGMDVARLNFSHGDADSQDASPHYQREDPADEDDRSRRHHSQEYKYAEQNDS